MAGPFPTTPEAYTPPDDWADRVVIPLARVFKELAPELRIDDTDQPDVRGPVTISPKDWKRTLGELDWKEFWNQQYGEEISYIPEGYGEQSKSRSPTLNEWADDADLQGRVPNWNEPLPIEIDEDKEDTVGSSGRVKEFSRPLIRKEGMNKPYTSDLYPNTAAMPKYHYYNSDGEGLDPDTTLQYDKMSDEEFRRMAPPNLERELRDGKDGRYAPGDPSKDQRKDPKFNQELMRLGGPQTGDSDAPYIPTGYGENAAVEAPTAQETPYVPMGYGEEPAIQGGIDPENKVPTNWFTGRGRFGGSPGEWGPQKTMQFITESIQGVMTQLDILRKAGNIEERIKAAEALELDPKMLGLFSDQEAKAGAASAFNMAAAGIGRGFTGGLNELGMFGGKMAAQISTQQGRILAERALKEGFNPEEVKAATGWYRNESGEMEFFMNPKHIQMLPEPNIHTLQTPKGEAKVTPLVSLITHPVLFKEFPDLATKGFIQLDPRLKPGEGEYNLVNGLHIIRMNPDMADKSFLPTLVHEINHGLQEINNFPRGADYGPLSKTAKKELSAWVEGKAELEPDVMNVVRERIVQANDSRLSAEQVLDSLKIAKQVAPKQYKIMLDELAEHVGVDRYHKSGGEVKSRLAAAMLQLSDREIQATDFATAGDVPVSQRTFDYRSGEQATAKSMKEGMTPDNDNFGIGEITSGLVSKLNQVTRGEEPVKSMLLIQRDIDKLESKVREMEGSGRKVVAEDVANWLEDAGVRGVTITEASTGTKYVKFPDPTSSNDLGQVRVPYDTHATSHFKPGLIETGTELTRKRSPSNLKKLEEASRNVEGGHFSVWENLVDALKWRLSKSPDGQWLISPGKEPRSKTKATKAEDTGDVISRDPDQLEFNLMQPQVQQQQQAIDRRLDKFSVRGTKNPGEKAWEGGSTKSTTDYIDRRIFNMFKEGKSQKQILALINEDREGANPISLGTIQRRLDMFYRTQEYKDWKAEQTPKASPAGGRGRTWTKTDVETATEKPGSQVWTPADTVKEGPMTAKLAQDMIAGKGQVGKRQLNVMDYVERTFNATGEIPSIRNIAESLGIKYPNDVRKDLEKLRTKGFLNREGPGKYSLNRDWNK